MSTIYVGTYTNQFSLVRTQRDKMLINKRQILFKCSVCINLILVVLLIGLAMMLLKINQRHQKEFIPGDERIFFHETSGARIELSFRQSCAVESAALHNPQRPIEIFFQPVLPEFETINTSSAWLTSSE